MTINYAQVKQVSAQARVDELTPYVQMLREAESALVAAIASMGDPLKLSVRDERRRMELQQAVGVLRDGSSAPFGAAHGVLDALHAAGIEPQPGLEVEPRMWWPLRQAERRLEAAEQELARVA